MNNICHICGRDVVSPVDPVCECAEELKRYRAALEVIANYPCVALTQDLKHAKLIAREALTK